MLALALGRTVSELEETVSSEEYSHWMAFYNLVPFGPERENIHAGIIASTIANVYGNKTKPSDFMLKDSATDKANKTKQFVAGLFALSKKKKPPVLF